MNIVTNTDSTTPRPTLVFAHANGFPGPCYAKLFADLQADFDIRAVPRFAHHADYPVSDGWPALKQQLIDFIEQGPTPVILVGHSLGGFLSFMVAAERPDLVQALILLDAPIFSRAKARALQASKHLGIVDRFTPGRASRGRRQHWPSTLAAYEHFRTRKLFRHFDPDCLADYVYHGMLDDPSSSGGRVLWFDAQTEYRIYCTIPHKMHLLLPKLQVPAGFIGGRQSRELRVFGISAMHGIFRMRPIEGGHLFPFERPLEAAVAIREMVAALRMAR